MLTRISFILFLFVNPTFAWYQETCVKCLSSLKHDRGSFFTENEIFLLCKYSEAFSSAYIKSANIKDLYDVVLSEDLESRVEEYKTGNTRTLNETKQIINDRYESIQRYIATNHIAKKLTLLFNPPIRYARGLDYKKSLIFAFRLPKRLP